MNHLFVYGTLMVKEVAEKVIGFHSTEKATLMNYKRHKIFVGNKPLPYPAIIYKENSITKGILFRNIADEYLDLLDQYEGEDYNRELVKITTPNETIKAWVYVWNNPAGTTLKHDWDEANFRKNHLHKFIEEERLY